MAGDMILVTGATGKVGGEVARRLVAAKRPVRALVRRADAALPVGVEVVVGTLDDRAALDRACAGVVGVFMGSFEDDRVLALQSNLINAAKGAGVARVARLSALGADAASPFFFARRHGEGDRQLLGAGIGAIALCPTWFDQNFLTYFPKGVLRMPFGDGRVPFIDVRDIADVAIAVLSATGFEGRRIDLTGPDALTHAEVAAILSQVTGRTFRFEDQSDEAFSAASLAAGMDADYLALLLGLMRRIRDGGSAEVHDGVRRVLGRAPIALDRFARDYAADLIRQL